jgi:DNA-binding beta-propeller fold protein YncE
MDESTLGGPRNSLRAGVSLRSRRRAKGAAFLAGAAVIAAAVQALAGGPALAQPAARTAQDKIAYIATVNGTVVPLNTVTNTVRPPITVPGVGTVAAAPNGRTVYAVSAEGEDLIPISTATDTTLKPIHVGTAAALPVSPLVITPDGRTGYMLGAGAGVLPVNLVTGTALKLITLRNDPWLLALSPNGRTVYALGALATGYAKTVTPIDTATNTALPPITLKVSPSVEGYTDSIAFTPNGKTAYVVVGVGLGKAYSNSVSPIDTVTGTAGSPIKLSQPGFAEKVLISPDGKTAYVLSAKAVTPISTATNTALPPISLPAAEGNAYNMVLTPNGQTIYVISPRGVTAISTATRSVRQLPVLSVGGPYGDPIAVTPDGRTVYVGTKTGVAAINTATNAVGPYITLTARSWRSALSIAFAR